MHFLEKIAKHILEHYREDLKDLIVVLPNIRAKLFLNEHLKRMAGMPMFMPIAFSSQELMEKLSGMKSADDFLLLSKLYRAYPEESEEMSFDLFMNWGNALLQDIKEMEHQLVDAPALFKELSDIRKMEAWSPNSEGLSDFQQKYLNFCQKLPELFESFEQEMHQDGMGHLGFLEKMASNNLEQEHFGSQTKFIVAGFNALTKAEEAIFDQLKKQYACAFFWDYDTYYLDDPIHEAGYFGRLNREKHSDAFQWVFNDYKEMDKSVSIYKCTTGYEQSLVVSEILKKIDSQDDLMNTAIVLADEGLLLPVLQSLPRKIHAVNVTMGYPLSHSPFYALFESIIKMYINLRVDEQSAFSGFYHKDVMRFLHSDAIFRLSGNRSGKALSEFTQNLIINQQVYLPAAQINELLCHILGSNAIQFEEKKSMEVLVDMFRAIILQLDKKLNETDQLMDKINREFLLHHLEVLEQVYTMLVELGERMDIITFHKIWRHYTKLAKVQFTGEPLNGLQIMGLLESRNLDFDNVIVLNVNEGTLPADKKFGSLIPNDLKRKYGMHLHKEKDAIFAYHFYRLLQRSNNIHLLYSSQVDEMGGGEKSRYIIQLQKELKPHHSGHEIIEIDAVGSKEIVPGQSKTIAKSEYIMELLSERISKGLSPTSLSTFLNCSMDFYYKYIVGIKEQKEVLENLEADVLGSAIHDTLEDLYRPLIGKTIQVSDIESMQKQFKKVLKAKFEQYVNPHFLMKGKNLLTLNMAGELLTRYFTLEKKNVKENTIELVDVELEVSKELKVECHGKSFAVRLNGKIDRVEKKNGQWNLIDYKSGNIQKSDTAIKSMDEIQTGKNKALQLLTYAYLFSDLHPNEAMAACLYPLKSYHLGYLSLNIEKNERIDGNVLKEFEQGIVEIVQLMLNTDLPFSHNEESTYCSFC